MRIMCPLHVYIIRFLSVVKKYFNLVQKVFKNVMNKKFLIKIFFNAMREMYIFTFNGYIMHDNNNYDVVIAPV